VRPELPEPLEVPWRLEENLTAKSGVDNLRDGRTKYWVDEILKGITPKMFIWWFSGGALGDMEIDRRTVSRYRVWHPYDHVSARLLVNRPADASKGAVAELEEYFGRNPEYYTNPAVRIDHIDEEAYTSTWFENGIAIAHLDHELEAVPGGLRLGHVMYIPGETTTVAQLLAPRVWPRAMGEAWIEHGIEEMGNFGNFLPECTSAKQHAAHPEQGAANQRTVRPWPATASLTSRGRSCPQDARGDVPGNPPFPRSGAECSAACLNPATRGGDKRASRLAASGRARRSLLVQGLAGGRDRL
jgi:DAPG hydrolase PhiG domain